MNDNFKLLLDTMGLWLPALTWLAGRLSATHPGRKIEDSLKARLKWLKDPEAEKAFHAAFRSGIERYEKEHGQSQAAQAVARVLTHVAEHDTTDLDRATIFQQIFAAQPDPEALSDVVKRHAFALEGVVVPVEDVSAALETLIVDYLRPAFRAQRYFTERVGFAEVVGLLQDIREAVTEPAPDLEALRRDYCAKMAEKYEYITMQGISPKVQNRTIGIRMEDVFIPLEATIDDLGAKETRLLEKARNLALHVNLQRLLDQVDDALAKFDKGTYGLCEDCGGRIDPARLKALPYATRCIQCQQKRERS